MKTTIVLIVAAILLSPVLARSQNESAKMTPSQSQNLPSPDASTQQMALLNSDQRAGGAAGEYDSYLASHMYMAPGWEQGYAVLKDKTLVDGLLLRYDLYHQQMQYIREEDTLAFSKPDELSYLFLGNKMFIYTDFEDNGVIKKGYFEVLHEGKCPLYLRRTVTYHISPDENSSSSKDIFVNNSEYYIRKQGQSARPIQASRKSILCAFSDKEQEVAKFMKDNKLNGKTCDQLKLVIAFYNSLP